jgi:hypothetical protein
VSGIEGLTIMSKISQPKKLTQDQLDRLWQRYISEEEIFNNRLNFFLVLESVLLGVTMTLYSQGNFGGSQALILRSSALLGLGLTLVWLYIAAKQKWILAIVRKTARANLPEFATLEEELEQGPWPFHIRTLLAYIVPSLFLLTWVILQFTL